MTIRKLFPSVSDRPVPADRRSFHAKRGSEFVVGRRCDVAEAGRVAIAGVESAPVPGAG